MDKLLCRNHNLLSHYEVTFFNLYCPGTKFKFLRIAWSLLLFHSSPMQQQLTCAIHFQALPFILKITFNTPIFSRKRFILRKTQMLVTSKTFSSSPRVAIDPFCYHIIVDKYTRILATNILLTL